MTLSQSDVKVLREALNTLADLGVPSVKELRTNALGIVNYHAQEAVGENVLIHPTANMETVRNEAFKAGCEWQREMDEVTRASKPQGDFVMVPREPTAPVSTGFSYAEIPDWQLRQWLEKLAIASQQPAPSGDARELAYKLHCAVGDPLPENEYFTFPDAHEALALIHSFATATLEEAVAKVKSHINNYEQKVACIEAIRALAKRP